MNKDAVSINELNIDSATITGIWDNTFHRFDYNLDFGFTIEKWVSPDQALEMSTKAISDFSDWLVKNKFDKDGGIYYNVCKRGFLKMGTFTNPLWISSPSAPILQNKVVPLDKSGLDSHSANFESYVIVYGISGTPFKGMVFCYPGKKRNDLYDEQDKYLGNHQFIFTTGLDRIMGNIDIEIRSPSFMLDLNPETQWARYGNFKATPENIFNVSTSPLIKNGKRQNLKYSIIPPDSKKVKSLSIRTSSYKTLYDKSRYDMNIDIPSAFNQRKNDVEIEPQQAFAEQVRKFMGDDIKWRVKGVADSFSIEYAPYETIEDVFNLAKSIANNAHTAIRSGKKTGGSE
jgi:hypothetical protein